MNRKLFSVLIITLVYMSAYSQNIWEKADAKQLVQEKLERASMPSHYQLFHLNLDLLKLQLQDAPLRGSSAFSPVVTQFPDGDGKLKAFRIFEAPVMHPELGVRYPGMKSYVGQGLENPSEIIRFSITLYGLHTMLSSNNGTSYTDPYTTDLQNYIVYKKEALTAPRQFRCDVADGIKAKSGQGVPPPPSTDGVLRTYRLAMSCTIEYAAFHIAEAGLEAGTTEEKTEAVLAAMNVTVTRLNSIYERDISLTLVLVPDNDTLIFIDKDEYDNFNTDNILLDQSQATIDAIVGFDNYDIGHTVSTGGGGVAQLWSPCSESKAKGITGLWAPVGDAFDIDFVAHEMGHQFGGNHTFNSECGGNRSDDNAYEPGSGTTIMAYAGVCDPNVQPHSDAHFHINSINEMSWFIANWGNCSENTITGNIPPVANAGADHTIPKGTAFILGGTATDADNDAMTYCWEQMDIEISEQPPSPDAAAGPNFRSSPPKDSPERYMPDLEDVLTNNLTPTWEVIPNVGRSFTFAFTVRDNNPLGGQVTSDNMKVDVSGEAGPFVVTYPDAADVSIAVGENLSVSWDVAGTTANGVNTPYVDILLSTDGGHTYPIVLAKKVPNDGSEVATIPNVPGNDNRVMIRGHNNIFYDISNADFTITAPVPAMAITVTGEQNITACKGSDVVYTFAYDAYAGFTGDIVLEVTSDGLPVDALIVDTISENGTFTVTLPDTGTESVLPGFYSFTISVTSGDMVKIAHVYLELIDAGFGDITLISPADNSETLPETIQFNWSASENTLAYQIDIAADEAFEDIIISETVEGTSFLSSFPDEMIYYWRVLPKNEACSGTATETFMFTTGITACAEYVSDDVPMVISDVDEASITSELEVGSSEPISRITLNLDIDHTWVGDLTVNLTSPLGTEITLFQNVCDDTDNIIAVFDDYGQPFICNPNPALSGTIIPAEALSGLHGESPQGVWKLTVSDNFNQDGGQLNGWSLNICDTHAPFVSGINENSLKNLSLFPNPNSGDFTVKFSSASGQDIRIAIYDIRGRQLLNQSVTNTGMIEQQLSLGDAQAGIYLVTIQDGNTAITKKIIIR